MLKGFTLFKYHYMHLCSQMQSVNISDFSYTWSVLAMYTTTCNHVQLSLKGIQLLRKKKEKKIPHY